MEGKAIFKAEHVVDYIYRIIRDYCAVISTVLAVYGYRILSVQERMSMIQTVSTVARIMIPTLMIVEIIFYSGYAILTRMEWENYVKEIFVGLIYLPMLILVGTGCFEYVTTRNTWQWWLLFSVTVVLMFSRTILQKICASFEQEDK